MPEAESRFSRTFRTTESVPELDLTSGVGQRSSTFRFDLVNGVTGRLVRTLTPFMDSAPTITHDTTRTIKRQLSGLNLGIEDTAAVNPLTDRIAVYMTVGSVDYPLGRFVFTDFAKFIRSRGDTSSEVLMDEMLIVDQQIERAFSAGLRTISSDVVEVAEPVSQMIERLLQGLPITYSLVSSPYYSHGSWSIGTNRGNIVESLALDGDYFSPWFDNTGVMRFIRAFDPATALPTFDFDAGNTVMLDTIINTSDVLDAPNRYIVVSNGTGNGASALDAVVGSYTVPESAPYSITNRGFVIPSVQTVQVNSVAQANALAKNIGVRNTIFERMTLDTAIDPRHDSYDVVRFQSENWLELAWSFTCRDGAPMRHVMRKTYS